jgi:hypothetical protein
VNTAGDVTGIKRAHTLVTGQSYTLGIKLDILDQQVQRHHKCGKLRFGAAPTWKTTAVKRGMI